MKISQNFIKSDLKFWLISEISAKQFWHVSEREIKTTTDTSIRLNSYRLPFMMTDKISDEVENM